MVRPAALITGPTSGITPRCCGRSRTSTAVIQLTRAVLPALLAAGAGTVVVGKSPVPGLPYKALATARRMLPRNLAHAAADRVGGGRGRS